MAKGYVPIFFDWLDTTQDLTAEEKGNLIDAVVSYAAGFEYEHLLSGASKIAFRFLKGQVDRNAAISDIRRQARENKKAQETSSNNKTEQNITNDNKTEQTQSNSQNKNNNKNKKENKNERNGFTPPTLDEVRQYCQERRNGINPQYFIDYYAARGWELSNGKKVKDWRACIRTWENRDRQQGKKVIAQDFSQRDYSDVPAQMMDDLAAEMAEFKKGAG